MKKSSLHINRRTLTAGVYIVKLSAVLEGVGLDGSDEVYMSIIEDSLQLTIIGGSFQQLPWKDDVILDASGSKDPNEVDQNQLQFEWYCEIISGDILLKDCFGNGENIVEYFGARWKIGKKILLEGVSYQFSVVVSNPKKNRQGSKKQTVLLVDAEIPVVAIRYLIYFGRSELKKLL